jgi:adenosylcobinamide-GDP ribazoletransferase
MDDLLRALSLLTTLPVRAKWDEHVVPGRVMAVYPLVGGIIGVLLAALAWVLHIVIPPSAGLLAPALTLAAWVALTGALHLDGWADCCDGLFAPVTRERRLEILKDPRLGSFGGVGLMLLLIVKLAALQGILARAGGPLPGWGLGGLAPFVVIPALARWAVVIAARAYPPARAEGMGAYFRRGLGTRELIIATVIGALIALLGGLPALAWWGAAALAMWLLARLAMARLGGLTGDVYGATAELAETVALVMACFWSV